MTDMIFSLRQVQDKCREQRMSLYITFIDLTKALDLVSRRGQLEILKSIGCPPKLLNIIASFHEDTHSILSFKGATSEAFPVSSGVIQDVYWLLHCLKSSSNCFSSMRSATAMRGFTSTQDQMASSSTLPDFVPKRSSGVSSSANFCLPTTQPLYLTL